MNDAYYNDPGLASDGHDNWVAQQEAQLRRELIYKLEWDFDRFPLPIEFDPREELQALGRRMKRITECVDRGMNIARIRFNKKQLK